MANKNEMTVVNNKYRIKERDISDRIFHIAVLVLSILCFIVILYPLWFVVIASISNSDMVNRGEVVFWPKDIRFYGFQQIPALRGGRHAAEHDRHHARGLCPEPAGFQSA